MSNLSPHHKRKADSISNNIDIEENNIESGYKVTFTWEHYPFPIDCNTPVSTATVHSIPALFQNIFEILGSVEKQNRIRDIVSILSTSTKILREVTNSNKAIDHKYSIFNFNNLEYSVLIQRKDTLYFLYDQNDGILARLGLCPQLIQIYTVIDTNQHLMGGSFVDNNIPCLCGLGSSTIAEQLLVEDEVRKESIMETDNVNTNKSVVIGIEGDDTNNLQLQGESTPIDHDLIVKPINIYNNLTTTPPELIKAIELKVPKAKKNIDIFWNEKIKELGLLQSTKREELRQLNDKSKSLENLLEEEKINNSKLQYRLEILEKQLLKMTRPLLPLSNN